MVKQIVGVFILLGLVCAGSVAAAETAPALTSRIQKGSLRHQGWSRTYLYYVPADLPAGRKPSLVLALHGGGGNAKSMVKLTCGRFNPLADRDGWIVVYPDGLQKEWNDGRYEPIHPGTRGEIDDAGFLEALVLKFQKERGTDPDRTYVTGISNGGLMSNRLACEKSGLFAAAAPVAASLSVRMSKLCAPSRPVPMMFLNGDQDPLVPFGGGEIHVLWLKRGKVLPAAEAALYWARRNGCDTGRPKVEDLKDRDPLDGTTVRRTTYAGGREGSEVVLTVLKGGGHTWPMGWPYLGEKMVGKVSREVDACDEIWEFFKRHKRMN